MHSPPVTEEGVVIDRIYLFEEHRHFDTWLIVWLGVVVELGGIKLVVNLFPSHCGLVGGTIEIVDWQAVK
jgi:hypothetical protein